MHKMIERARSATKNVARNIRSHFYSSFRSHNICMLHIGRCGSTVLANMLDQHPSIHWKGEFFHEENLPRYLGQYNTEDPFQALWFKSGAAKRRSFGFEIKAHPNQQPSDVGESLKSMIEKCVGRLGCRHFILLTRAHILRRFVSYLVGSKRKKWNYNRGEEPEKVKVRVPTGSSNGQIGVLEFIEGYDGIVERWKEFIPDDCETLELEYARDILGNPHDAYYRVAEWLGLDEFTPTVDVRKAGTEPLDSVVMNWEEVRKVLNGTPYAWMLNDEGAKVT